tara:strand:- start:6195 stop:7250 length:1056 start_codon:yes stop_codon:yes gene_type:complete
LLTLGGVFDYDHKVKALSDLANEINQPSNWADLDVMKRLKQDQNRLQQLTVPIDDLDEILSDLDQMIDLAVEEEDEGLFNEIQTQLNQAESSLEQLEFNQMFSLKEDALNAFLEIQAGSGGTEAQDWADMLLRMYLRFIEQKGFKHEMIDHSPGEVAGIKCATIKVIGAYAYGWLRSELGVHRLVRKSPFDSGNRRHTSFASVFVSPEIIDDIHIEIDPSDLRVDTYRSSGAGGQHVNTTDSAVRITHIPTGIVAQCQNDRSQHKNKAQAMTQLKAKLHQKALQEKMATKEALESSKAEISWGNQIRSYVLDASRIKDLRTGVEQTHTQAVLDGALEPFIVAYLKLSEDTK